MQAAPISVTTIADNIDVSSMKLPDVTNVGDFQALLNIGITQSQTNGGQANSDQSSTNNNSNNQNNQNQTPVAAAIDVPVPITSAPPVQPSSDQASQNQDSADVQNNSNNQNSSPTTNTNQNTQSTSSSSSTSSTSSDTSSPVQNGTNQNNTGSTTSPKKQQQSSLQDQLTNIEQILLAIAQALSLAIAQALSVVTTGQNTSAQTDSQTSSVTDTSSTTGASLTTPAITLPTDITNLTALTSSDPSLGSTSSESALSILQDLQSILQDMEQTLQGSPSATDSSSAQAGSTSNLDTLDALAQMLQQDTTQLSQLLFGQTSTTNNAPQVTISNAVAITAASTPLPQTNTSNTTPAVNTTPSLSDLAQALNATVSVVKTQLQQLQPNNQAQSTQTQNGVQAAFANAIQFFKDALGSNDSASSDNTVSATTAVQGSSIPTSGIQLISSDQTVVTPTTTTDQVLIAPASVIDVVQNVSNNSSNTGSDNSGQGQNSSQPIIPAVFDKSASTQTAGGASFSQVLNGVSSGSVIEQVSFQVKTALNNGSSKINIQLDPAELGKVEIKLSVGTDGKTNAVITADNSSTLNMLQGDSKGLAQALTDAGLSTDSGSLSFNLRGDQQGQGQSQGGNAQTAINTYQQTQPDAEEDVAVNSITSSYVVNLSGGLDISI